jgi:hypothetical protein
MNSHKESLVRNSEIIQKVQQDMKRKGIKGGQVSAFNSELRREIVLQPNTNRYELNYHQGLINNASPTESVLTDNDMFVITEIGFHLLRKYAPVAAPNLGVVRQDHNLDTFPNNNFYGAAYQEFENLYGGRLKFSIENSEIISGLFLRDANVKRVGKFDNNVLKQFDEQDGKRDGFIPCALNYDMKGWARTKFAIEFPNVGGSTFAIPDRTIAGQLHKGVAHFALILRGVNISNAAYLYKSV